MKQINPVRLAFLLVVLVVTGCKVAINSDIKDAVYPDGQPIELSYKARSISFDKDINLPETLDEFSSWQTISITNKNGSDAIVIKDVTLDDETDFQTRYVPVSTSILPLEKSSFQVRYKTRAGTEGTLVRTLTINYTIQDRPRMYKIRLVGQRADANSPIIEVRDAASNVLDHEAGIRYDFGYDGVSKPITRTFTIKNTGNQTLEIRAVYPDNSSLFKVSAQPSTRSLPSGGSTTFSVELQATAANTFSNSHIVIESNSAKNDTFLLNIAGGGPTIPLGGDDFVAYKLDKTAVEFGQFSTGQTRTISIKNTATTPLVILSSGGVSVKNIDNTDSATPYSISATGELTVAPGADTTVTIKSSLGATEWAERKLVIRSEKGRTKEIWLTGSGFKQPDDSALAGSLALWLKADRIAQKDVDPFNRIIEISDVKNPDLYALSPKGEESKRPKYVENSGINDFPAIHFDVAGLLLTAQNRTGAPLYSNALGGTVFLVTRHGTVSGIKYLLRACGFSSGVIAQGGVFPQITTAQSDTHRMTPGWILQARVPDTIYNFITTQAYGSTAQNTKVYLYNSFSYVFNETPTSNTATYQDSRDWWCPTNEKMTTLQTGGQYAITLRCDFSYSSTPATESNQHFWLNGGKKHTYRRDQDLNWATSLVKDTYYYSHNYNKTLKELYIGGNYNYDNTFNGYIAEIIMYNRPLTDAEVKAVNDYLMYKYEISP